MRKALAQPSKEQVLFYVGVSGHQESGRTAVSVDAINTGSKLNGLSMSISLNRVKDTHWLAWRAIREGFVDF